MSKKNKIYTLILLLIFSIYRKVLSIEIVIKDKIYKEKKETSQPIEIVSSKEIKDKGALTLGESIEIIPEIYTEKTGDAFSSTNFFLRGLSSGKIAFLINNTKLPAPQYNIIGPSSFIGSYIERIEIYKGSIGALFGEGALGGAINIILKHPQKNRIFTNLFIGSFNTYGGEIGTSQKKQNYSHIISIGGLYTKGDFTYYDEKNQITKRRVNNYFLDGNLFYYGKYKKAFFIILGDKNKKGIPGSIEFPTYNAYLENERTILISGLNLKSIDIAISSTYNYQKFYNDLPIDTRISYHKLISIGGSIEYKYIHKTLYGISTKIEGNLSYVDSNSLKDQLKGTSSAILKRNNIDMVIKSHINILKHENNIPKLILELGTRGSKYTDYRTYFTEYLGLLWHIDKGYKYHLKTSVSNAVRLPKFNELFWSNSFFAMGNPYLKPEKGKGFDIEGILKTIIGTTSLSTYAYRYTDLIRWIPGLNGIWSPINIEKIDIYGASISNNKKILINSKNHIELELGYNITIARYTNNNLLPRYPPERAKLKISYTKKRVLRLVITFTYTGFRYLNDENTKYVSPYKTIDLSLFITPNKSNNIETYLYVYNITNEKYIDISEYPNPGREIRGGIKIFWK